MGSDDSGGGSAHPSPPGGYATIYSFYLIIHSTQKKRVRRDLRSKKSIKISCDPTNTTPGTLYYAPHRAPYSIALKNLRCCGLWFIAFGCFLWRSLPRVARLRRHSWFRVSRIRCIVFDVNFVPSEWYSGRTQLILGTKVGLYEDCSHDLGARKRYPESLHLIVKHEWLYEPNWKEKQSQSYYQAHNLGRFFDGFMDATSLLKWRL